VRTDYSEAFQFFDGLKLWFNTIETEAASAGRNDKTITLSEPFYSELMHTEFPSSARSSQPSPMHRPYSISISGWSGKPGRSTAVLHVRRSSAAGKQLGLACYPRANASPQSFPLAPNIARFSEDHCCLALPASPTLGPSSLHPAANFLASVEDRILFNSPSSKPEALEFRNQRTQWCTATAAEKNPCTES
jgi:hypothetical protein